MKRKKKHKKKTFLKFLLVIIILLSALITIVKIKNMNIETTTIENKKVNLKDYYNELMITNKDSNIYIKENEEYKKIGKIYKDTIIKLKQLSEEEGAYFSISDMDDDYYINYKDVSKSDKKIENNDRYKNYIVYNENVVADKINLYEDDKLIYTLNKKISLPIYIKEKDTYYVEYNNRLLNVKKDEVETIKNNNTDKSNISGVGVLNYHFFYDENNSKEVKECNQEICESNKLFQQQLDYLKNNNIMTITTSELEKYVDGKIQLPKSVLITIDDGWMMDNGLKLLEKNEMYGCVFLITSWFKDFDFMKEYKYVEFQSHGDNIHNTGACPGGQGGGIKCLPKDQLLEDLKNSSKKLNGSTVFAYPFYEQNDYSIEVLKEAEYTMAFVGESTSGDNLAHVGDNKYKLPRFVMVNYTTERDLNKYFNNAK